jgi:hypothetical protein
MKNELKGMERERERSDSRTGYYTETEIDIELDGRETELDEEEGK